MIEIVKTEAFQKWEAKLKDKQARALISLRIARLSYGHFGDVKSVKGGVNELRINYGPGYRLYYTRRGKEIVLLLYGGDKGTQQYDIEKAKKMIKQLGEENE